MTQVPVLRFQDFISADGDQLTTTSHQVAAVFGKRHDDLLKRIRSLMSDLPIDRLGYFAETVETRHNPSGGALIQSPGYSITRDGFTLLAMGFTGKKALTFKLAYIDAFNAMAAYIRNQREGLRFQCMETLLECKDSERRGSFHGKGLSQRKQEKRFLEPKLAHLLAQAQPSLLN